MRRLVDKFVLELDVQEAKDILDEFLGRKEGSCIPCELTKILGHESKEVHNCLACSFYGSFITIRDYILEFDIKQQYFNRGYFFYNFYQWMNLVIEKVKYIQKILRENKLNTSLLNVDDKDSFPDFYKINKTANFFKHPKVFSFTHHIDYLFSYEELIHSENYEIVNFDSILKYFTGINRQYKENDFFKEYSNKKIAIKLSPISDSIWGICNDFEKIIHNIRTAKPEIEFLRMNSSL